MRIHTNTVTTKDVHDALAACKAAGLIADHVHFEVLSHHGSRKRHHALEIQLGTYIKVKGDKRSWKNSGTYGASDVYAATYDEWGYFLAALYHRDADLLVPWHGDREGFVRNTSRKMNTRQEVFDYMTPTA